MKSRKQLKGSSAPAYISMFALALFLLAACGGMQEPSGSSVPAAIDEPVAEPTAQIVREQDGSLRLKGTLDGDGRWGVLFPRDWPVEMGPAPIVGVAHVAPGDDAAVNVIAIREITSVENLEVARRAEPPVLSKSKQLVLVEEVSDGEIRLAVNGNSGVSRGDLYFIISRDPGVNDWRLGESVGALARVTEVLEKYAIARLEHVDSAPQAGQLAVFAQANLDIPSSTSTIVFASLDPEGTAATSLPPLGEALPQYMATFQLTNIGIESTEERFDPAVHNAPSVAAEAMEDRDGYGVLVFGEFDGAELTLNTSVWGEPPHPGSTVGILPGGLPIPAPAGLAAMSPQLAPSFIATVLALRGDHALAVYFLEVVLRTEELEPEVRYHLREHLALRYDSLARFDEGLVLMNQDVRSAEAADQLFPLLNALSIRTSLGASNGLAEQEVLDSRRFLDEATGTLPSQSLGGERLQHARALSAVGRSQEARDMVDNVMRDAARWDDDDLLRSATIELAFQLTAEDPAGALLMMDSMRERQQDDEERVSGLYLNLFSAEIAAAADVPDSARRYIETALEAIEEDDSLALRASVYRRAASLFSYLGLSGEAVTAQQEAARVYLATAQLDTASEALLRLAILQLDRVGGGWSEDGAQLVQEARANVLVSGELSLHLGAELAAAQSFLFAGFLESQLGFNENADLLLRRAERLALACADYRFLYELETAILGFETERGNLREATMRAERRLIWARAGGFDPEPIDAVGGQSF